jgi:hypothetical protein
MLSRRCHGDWPRRGLRRTVAAIVGLSAALVVLGSAVVPALAGSGPVYTKPPSITGRFVVGERVVCGSFNFKGSPKFKYIWVREGIEFEEHGENPSEHVLTSADLHHALSCIVAATEEGITDYVESINAVCLGGECGKESEPGTRPELVSAPTVTPKEGAVVGTTLTCSNGTWRGSPAPEFSYRWLLNGEAISGATAATFKVIEEDAGNTLSCKVTAHNTAGEASEVSSNQVKIPGKAPENRVSPELIGQPAAEKQLTCRQGEWTGSEPITYTFHWLRNGAQIAGETGVTYTVQAADEGKEISCEVTATNSTGKASKKSNPKLIQEATFTSTTAPSITGKPEKGQKLTCSGAKWSQPTSGAETYEWEREKTNGSKETIAGAKSETLVVEEGDVGDVLYCVVGATNSTGKQTAHATSGAFSIPSSGVPALEGGSAPSITGTPELGHELVCQHGSWTEHPTSYLYQWMREGSPISTAKNAGYEVQKADEGYQISCQVIAKNGEGPSAAAVSSAVLVPGTRPLNTAPPEVSAASKEPRVGEALTCQRGQWEGAPAPEYHYEWLHNGVGPALASTALYTVKESDRGYTLSCVVRAENSAGYTLASSNGLYVKGTEPEGHPGYPKIEPEGAPVVESTVTCNQGPWTGAPAPEFTYQWLVDGTPIPGATARQYLLTGAARTHILSCAVTGRNSEGERTIVSAGVYVAGEAPSLVEEPPYVVGSGQVGHTLICEHGNWQAKPPPYFAYQWYRNSTPIGGATEERYVIAGADTGDTLSCNVVATNNAGSAEAESINGVLVSTHTVTGESHEPESFLPPPKPLVPSAAVVLAALKRQLITVLGNVHLKKLRSKGAFSFPFIPPSTGTLELQWYQALKGAHGARGRNLVVTQFKGAYANTRQTTLKLKLTGAGKLLLRGKSKLTLVARASFTLPHSKPVVASISFTLSH